MDKKRKPPIYIFQTQFYLKMVMLDSSAKISWDICKSEKTHREWFGWAHFPLHWKKKMSRHQEQLDRLGERVKF